MDDKPLASQALLDYLDSVFPDECPDLSLTDRQVWFNAGRASVVRKLKSDIKEATQKEE